MASVVSAGRRPPARDLVDPRRRVLHVVEDDLDLREQPLLERRAAWWIPGLVRVDRGDAQRLRHPDGRDDRQSDGGGLDPQ
jgi:hypothetical protein